MPSPPPPLQGDEPQTAERLARLVRLAERALDAPIAFAAVTEAAPTAIISADGRRPAAVTEESVEELCRIVAAEGAPRIATGAGGPGGKLAGLGLAALLAVPLPGGAGALAVADTAPRRWSEREVELMADLAAAARDDLAAGHVAREARHMERLAQIGTWEWIAEGDIVRSSPAHSAIWGMEHGEERTVRDFVARVLPDDRTLVGELFAAGRRGRRRFTTELRVVRPGGELRHLFVSAEFEHDPDGTLVRGHGITQDITEQRVAGRWRERAEPIGAVGSWEYDLASRHARWSEEIYRIVGMDPDTPALAPDAFSQLVRPRDRARLRAALRATEAGESLDVTLDIARPHDGEIRTIRLLGEAPRDARGNALRMTGTLQDVTEHRRVTALLRDAELRFGETFESTTVPMALVELDLSRFLRVNRALVLGSGRSEEELLRMSPIDLLPPEDANVDDRALADLVTGRRASLEAERRFLLPDGQIGVAAVHLAVVRAPDGTPLYGLVQARDLTRERRTQQQLVHTSLHHPLTGLANRALFLDRLAHALHQRRRRGSEVAVLAIDIYRLRAINERYGLSAGDATLQAVANRLAGNVRGADTVGHLGEDMFAVISEDLHREHEALELAARLQRLLADPIAIGSERLSLTVSIGIATSAGAADAEALVRDAELAAVAASQRGGDRWEVFDPVLREELIRRTELEQELRRAIDEGELRVHYQPIVRSDGRELLAVEALVRWEHPRRGLLPPGEFLPVAEESGLDVALGTHVLRVACNQAQAWAEDDPAWEGVGVSVNVTARQLDQPDFVATVAAVLAEAGLRPERLRLEITETALMRSPNPAGIVAGLRELGVLVILDDFGTGYSSLSHLRAFDVDELKIDRSFVADIHTDAQSAQIVDAIVAMARALSLKVVAEGIESANQLQKVAALGCQAVQGFLIARPAPADDVRRDLLAAAR